MLSLLHRQKRYSFILLSAISSFTNFTNSGFDIPSFNIESPLSTESVPFRHFVHMKDCLDISNLLPAQYFSELPSIVMDLMQAFWFCPKFTWILNPTKTTQNPSQGSVNSLFGCFPCKLSFGNWKRIHTSIMKNRWMARGWKVLDRTKPIWFYSVRNLGDKLAEDRKDDADNFIHGKS